MAEGAFEKDFGYLIPFLDKVTAASGSLADPAARDELRRLLAGEKERWSRIRELLAGSSGGPSTSLQSHPLSSTLRSDAAESQPAPPEQQIGPAFTVGSLRPRR